MLSLKRMWAGNMTREQVTTELEAVKPGIILWSNDSRELTFQELLNREYQIVYIDDANRLFVLKSIARKGFLATVSDGGRRGQSCTFFGRGVSRAKKVRTDPVPVFSAVTDLLLTPQDCGLSRGQFNGKLSADHVRKSQNMRHHQCRGCRRGSRRWR